MPRYSIPVSYTHLKLVVILVVTITRFVGKANLIRNNVPKVSDIIIFTRSVGKLTSKSKQGQVEL